ncbi:hypothetical protein Tco_0822230 [Tanacetum coccineum]|uniref:Uncharacterized protein n=1 Tax=Tanacetum coccineum TaxID=301880 RepID=A0ABQ5AFJ4_9ASTR
MEIIADSRNSPHQGEFVIHPGSVAARIKDRNCRTRGGSSKPHVRRLPDVLELQDANACHLKIFAITPPAWKGHLENQLDLELLDLHDRCYEKEKARDQECEELRVKCETTMNEFDKNPTVIILRENIASLPGEIKVASLEVKKVRLEAVKASLCQELENAKLDRVEVVSKAFEEVANMKEPFDLTKVKGYRPSYKQELTMTGNKFATATFPYLADVVTDPYASVETLLSKKPRVLQRLVLTRTHVPASSAPSRKATSSSAPTSQPLSPPLQVTPAAASVTKPQYPPPTQ